MEPIDRLLAIEDIKHLKARYFRYVDQQDWVAFRSLFLDDAHFELGAGVFEGADAMLDHVRGMLSGGNTVHHGHMPEIDVVSSDEAKGTWTLFDRVVLPVESSEPSFCGYARYWETYQRIDGRWYISSLRIERLHRLPFGTD